MPLLSQRSKNIPASPIRKLIPYAEGAVKRGIKVYHLNIGQPDIHTPEVALNAMRNLDKKVLEYSHSAGYESYRRKLAGFYRNAGIDISWDQTLITTGASEAISFAVNSCLDYGDEIIIPEPFYANYNALASIAGVRIVSVTSGIEVDFALPPVSEIEKKISEKTRAILLCNPNNPTGYVYSAGELDQIRELVKKYNLFLFR